MRFVSRLIACAVLAGLLSTAHAVPSEAIARIPRGAVVVFYGDSLTARGDDADGWVSLLRRKFSRELGRPDIRLINAGRGGTVADDLLASLQAEFPKPVLVAVVGIGINDVARDVERPPSGGAERYGATLRSIARRLTQSGARVLIWSPLVLGEEPRGANGKDDLADLYVSSAAEAAKAEGVRFVDARSSFFAHKAASASSATMQPPLTSDGLHLNAAGNRFLFELIFAELVAVAGQAPAAAPRQ
jgi:lysophospholipase L1-like esterase